MPAPARPAARQARSAIPFANPPARILAAVKAVLFVLALLPLLRLAAGVVFELLGANPIEFITRSTGTWTLVFLLITLAVTPLRRVSGWNWLLRMRRMLGLFAFFYACLHFTTYIWLDQFFDAAAIVKDIAKRPFITIGFAAFLMMLPLAATSWNAMVKRLGARRWLLLHRLTYAVALGGVFHYWWLVKRDLTQPLIYGLVLALLLGVRMLWYARRRGRPAHSSPAGTATAASPLAESPGGAFPGS
jgi:sulfoxide reductase heme-binding subunit YedZ